VSYARGGCVASDNANFKIDCITSPSGIGEKYNSFSSQSSGRVTFTASTLPVVTTGGACVGGFDRAQSRLIVDTTFADQILPVAGSSITEIVYKPAFLSSIASGLVSQVSILVFADMSNTDRVGVVAHVTVSREPVVFAIAGTVTDAGAASASAVCAQLPGAHCIVAALDQFSSTGCSSAEGFCYADWVQFGGPASFR
jgi:hypothetical protein